jgi:hypothetical protein
MPTISDTNMSVVPTSELEATIGFFQITPGKARFQVLTAASIKMTVFWDVATCNLVEVYRRFRGVCCLPLSPPINLHEPPTS